LSVTSKFLIIPPSFSQVGQQIVITGKGARLSAQAPATERPALAAA
jgi:hypothetical protein